MFVSATGTALRYARSVIRPFSQLAENVLGGLLRVERCKVVWDYASTHMPS
jgi:hypothetical protein